MRSTYARYGVSSDASPRTPRERTAPRSYYSSSVSTTRALRDVAPTRDRESSEKVEDSDSDTADGYTDLRAKMRTLQREATRATANLEALNREKEDLSVALTHAKRDKAKAVADSEVIELERDSLERENKRIKTKLELSSKELRDLNEERRQLSERLRTVEVLKRSALADDKDAKSILSKMQDDIQTLRHQNLQLEEKVSDAQDQLRRAKLLSSIASSTMATSRESSVANGRVDPVLGTRTVSRKESEVEIIEEVAVVRPPRVSALALSGLHRERADKLDSGSSDSPPGTPSRGLTNSARGAPSPSAFRVEHLKVELDTARKELSKLQEANHDLSKKLRDTEQKLSASKNASRDLEATSSAADSAQKSANKRADEAEARKRELLAENEALVEAEAKVRHLLESGQRELQRAKEEAANARAQLDKADMAAKKEADAKRKAQEALAVAEKALLGKDAERVQLVRSASKSVVDLQGSRDELSQLELKHAKLDREVATLNTQITALKTTVLERQTALDAAHHETRTHLDKIRELSTTLEQAEETQKKNLAARKKAEEHAGTLETQLRESAHAREALASELAHRKQDLTLQVSEVARLKNTLDYLQKSVDVAKQVEESAQRDTMDAKHQLDHAHAELQAAQLTIEQLQREAASQNAKAIASVVSGASVASPPPSTPASSSTPVSEDKIGQIGSEPKIAPSSPISADVELKLRQLAEKLTVSQKEKADAEAKYITAEKERAKSWTDLKSLQTQLNRANADLQLGGRIVTDLQEKLKEAESKWAKSEEDARRLHENQEKVADALRGDLGNAKRELKIKDGLLATQKTQLSELETKVKAAQTAQTNGAEHRAELVSVGAELAEAKQTLDDAQTQLTASKHYAATMAMKVQAAQSTIETQQAQIQALNASQLATKASSTSAEELEKLRRELKMSEEVTESSKMQLEKIQSELEKTRTEASKQAKADIQLRKTLSRQCEQWQHQAGAYQSQIERIKKEMVKSPALRTALEPIVGATSSSPAPSSSPSLTDEYTAKVTTVQAFCRGALDRLRHKHWRYRYLKVKEMVETEESYLKALELGWQYFLNPLQTLVKIGDAIINQEEIDLIFTSLAAIRQNNKEVLAMLKARLNTWHVNQLIGDVFNEILSKGLLQPHVTFAQAYSKSTENRVRITKENVGFSRLLTIIRMLPPMEGRSLEDILIGPIQRIPRYILLINDMVKHTKPQHVDYNNLVTAYQAFQQFATFINENNRRAETMTDINTRLSGYEAIPENPHRKLIHEGRLMSISKSEKTPRYVFLFSDFIVFGKESKNKRKSGSVKGGPESLKVTTKFVTMIKVSPSLTVTEIGVREVGGSMHPHLLSVMVGESSNLLQATSESDMKLWVGKLRETFEESQLPPKSPQIEHRSVSPSNNGAHAQFNDGNGSAPGSGFIKERERSRRLSVDSAVPKSGSSTPPLPHLIPNAAGTASPARTSSLNVIPIREVPEEATLSASSSSDLLVSVNSSLSSITLQTSSSSGSLDVGGSSRKARTLAKRHKNSAKPTSSTTGPVE